MGIYEYDIYKLGIYVDTDLFNKWNTGGKTIPDYISLFHIKDNKTLISFKTTKELFKKIDYEIRDEKEMDSENQKKEFNDKMIAKIKNEIDNQKDVLDYLRECVNDIDNKRNYMNSVFMVKWDAEKVKRYANVSLPDSHLEYAKKLYNEITGLDNFSVSLNKYKGTWSTL
jgi:hypothetical protein